MARRNFRIITVVAGAVLLAACGATSNETPSAATDIPSRTVDDSPTTSSPSENDSAPESSISAPAETTPPDSPTSTTATTTTDDRPSCLQSDIVTEEGFTSDDWPDDFCEYWPSIHDTFEPLPATWRAPEGWVELDTSNISFGWRASPEYVLPPEGVDPRLRAFTFNRYTSEGSYYSGFVSEEMPIGGSIAELPDGVYTASLVEWDRSIPDRAVFRIAPILDCVPGGVWGESDVWGEPLCWGEPGERHVASPTCGPMRDLCVEVEVTLDDSFTVMTSGYSKVLNEQGYPNSREWIAQGPAFVELLTTLHDDYHDTFIANSSLGPERIESEIVPNSPFVSVIQGVSDENDEKAGIANFYNTQVFAWSRPNFPLVTMRAHGNWGSDWTSPSLFPITPWGLEHFYDEEGPDTCAWWELNYTRPLLTDNGYQSDLPCRITEGIFSFYEQLPRNGGSFMKIDGRTAWVMDLPYANS